MIWHLIWIIPLITFIISLIYFIIKDNGFESGVLIVSLLIAVLSVFISIPIVSIVFGIVENSADKTFTKTSETKIYSNIDNKYLTIVDKDYKIYLKDDKTTYTNLSQSDSTLFEDNKCILEKYTQYYTNGFVKWLIGNKTDTTKYEIHIPKGSITTEYKIDLK